MCEWDKYDDDDKDVDIDEEDEQTHMPYNSLK